MNIILIGFMGTGKSKVGKILSQRLNMSFLDTDDLIEKTEGRKISEIFKKEGVERFRDLETEVLKTLLNYEDFVLSCGGGIVLREENVKILKETGKIVLLCASPETILKRTEAYATRPLLENGDKLQKIKEILSKREPVYNSVADHKIDTSDKSPEEIAEEIINYAKNKS